MSNEGLQVYEVWDKPTRWFHWINVLSVLGLIGLGLIMLNGKALEIQTQGKILLKEAHVWVGYVFVCNLVARLLWGFFGNRYTRWGGILPGGFGYLSSLRGYAAGLFTGHPKSYLGHNPLGRIGIAIMLVLLVVQAISGLVLAGTDIFYPPLGNWIAEWIAAEGVDPASLAPYAKDTYDPQAFEEMRAFRSPFITTHYYAFYVLAAMIVVHIAAVVIAETREGGTLVSAMFSGRKIVAGVPADLAGSEDQVAARNVQDPS